MGWASWKSVGKHQLGPLSTAPLPRPTKHQTVTMPATGLAPGLDTQRGGRGGHDAIRGQFPRARRGAWSWAALSAPRQAVLTYGAPEPPHPCPRGKTPALENCQGFSEGAGTRQATLQQCPCWASQALELGSASHTTSALLCSAHTVATLNPCLSHVHTCYLVCARALGLLPYWRPNPHDPHRPAHTHVCLLHTLATGHKVSGRGQGQGPPSSHPPPTHRPMSEQILESAATAAWANAWGPQWTRCQETTTIGTMMASASPSPSSTMLIVAPWPWAMALWPRGREEVSGHTDQWAEIYRETGG